MPRIDQKMWESSEVGGEEGEEVGEGEKAGYKYWLGGARA